MTSHALRAFAARHAAPTHQVLNQAKPLADYNMFLTDRALVEAVEREGGGWAAEHLTAFGARCGSAEVLGWGHDANAHPPEFASHDRFGRRTDAATFHPAYHRLMELAVEAEVPSFAWNRADRAGAHVARAALPLMLNQVDAGVNCPLTMTFAAVPALQHSPALLDEWLPRLCSTQYDARDAPAADKTACQLGMSMTEKQGGSDVRANTTRAEPVPDADGWFALRGHKWFTSAPMCDAFLTLAYTDGGLSCFLVPRWLPDGQRNEGFRVMRLKSKLGDRSNASSEVEYDNALGQLVGEEGGGVRTILEMVTHTRLDCMIGSSSTMRHVVAQAANHTAQRSAFGDALSRKPLMANVLADLAVEAEAATMLTMRVARAFDEAPEDEGARLFARLATAVGKYWVCKRTPGVAYEAMECHGGNGYVEDGVMARMYRQAPLNSIWEGSGNVMALDMLRALAREPQTMDALMAELATSQGMDAWLDLHTAELQTFFQALMQQPDRLEANARTLADRLAVALQGSLMVRFAPSPVAEAFCAARLGKAPASNYGALPEGLSVGAIVDRATPLD